MGVNSLPKTVTGQRRGCDLNPGPTAPESSTLTTRLPSHPSSSSSRGNLSSIGIMPRVSPAKTEKQVEISFGVWTFGAQGTIIHMGDWRHPVNTTE